MTPDISDIVSKYKLAGLFRHKDRQPEKVDMRKLEDMMPRVISFIEKTNFINYEDVKGFIAVFAMNSGSFKMLGKLVKCVINREEDEEAKSILALAFLSASYVDNTKMAEAIIENGLDLANEYFLEYAIYMHGMTRLLIEKHNYVLPAYLECLGGTPLEIAIEAQKEDAIVAIVQALTLRGDLRPLNFERDRGKKNIFAEQDNKTEAATPKVHM